MRTYGRGIVARLGVVLVVAMGLSGCDGVVAPPAGSEETNDDGEETRDDGKEQTVKPVITVVNRSDYTIWVIGWIQPNTDGSCPVGRLWPPISKISYGLKKGEKYTHRLVRGPGCYSFHASGSNKSYDTKVWDRKKMQVTGDFTWTLR